MAIKTLIGDELDSFKEYLKSDENEDANKLMPYLPFHFEDNYFQYTILKNLSSALEFAS